MFFNAKQIRRILGFKTKPVYRDVEYLYETGKVQPERFTLDELYRACHIYPTSFDTYQMAKDELARRRREKRKALPLVNPHKCISGDNNDNHKTS